jgi:hypothetical protein
VGSSVSERPGAVDRAGIEQIVGSVADRLADPVRVAAALRTCVRPAMPDREYTWVPYTLARGFAGLALSMGLVGEALDRPESARWRNSGHRYLEAAVRGLEGVANPPPGLFTGTAGVAAAACVLSDGRHYRGLLQSLSRQVRDGAHQLASAARAGMGALPVSTFDHISGLTGLAALLASPDARPVADDDALHDALAALTAIVLAGGSRRGWFTPPEFAVGEWMERTFPRGNLNCGLAHGVTGILAVLSVTWRDGVRLPGQDEAIAVASNWLLAQRLEDPWGVNWPLAVDVEEPDPALPPTPSHAAWCYGSPGVARALWLAGAALSDEGYGQAAVDAIRALLARPVSARRIASPCCCHGTAGLLQVLLVFAADGVVDMTDDAPAAVLGEVVDAYRASHPLGYRTWEQDGWVDQPALLDGAAGVPLVLLEATGRRLPLWRRLLLLD